MPPPLPVVIDTDPAIGLPGRDVDDGLALLQACRHPALDVRAVTTVFGNAEIADTYPLAQEVLALGGYLDIPVARGAAGAHESDCTTPAVELLIETFRAGPHTLLALGPLTNVGAALRQAPDIADNVTECVFVGGRHPGVDFLVGTATAGLMDLNFELDPAAAQTLLDTRIPVVYAGFEISEQIRFTRDDVAALAARDTAITQYLAPHLAAWIDHWQQNFAVEFFHPFDTLAVGYLTDPDLFTMSTLQSEIVEIQGRAFLHAQPEGPDRPVRFCERVDAPRFHERLMALLD